MRRKAGSSPRVRGTLRRRPAGAREGGIIPACAGNTPGRWRRLSAARDYPRVCGEHNSIRVKSRIVSDHPRVCGEHGAVEYVPDAVAGSSPRVRGTPADAVRGEGAAGIDPRVCGEHQGEDRADDRRQGSIPACAGNTFDSPLKFEPREDHPRVCGEHSASSTSFAFGSGSSPRVRGTRELGFVHPSGYGIIPACAGNTICRRSRRRKSRVIPACAGNTVWHYPYSSAERDRSPRVRGTPYLPVRVFRFHGIIPACAGNTHRANGPARSARDHPRVCGEHAVDAPDARHMSGSSPRVRGTPRLRFSGC